MSAPSISPASPYGVTVASAFPAILRVLSKLGGVLQRLPASWCVPPMPAAEMWLPLQPGCIHPLTPHAVVAQRVEAAVGQIDASLSAAQRRGDLAFFNQAYKARRVAAAAQGRGFMAYGVALRRLRQAVAGAAANGGQCTRSLMLSVFADGEP